MKHQIFLLCVFLLGCSREELPPSPVFHASAWEGNPVVVADSESYARPGAVQALDVDQDNDPDIAAVGPDRLLLFENVEGTGTTFRRHSLDDQGSANGLLVMDVDADGFPDLLSATGGPPDGRTQPGFLCGWRNPGSPEKDWKRHVLDPTPLNFLHDILVADLDNDGREEIVAPRGAGYLKDDHKFDGLFVYQRTTGKDSWSWLRITLQGPDGAIRPEDFGLAAGDMNNDGRCDIVQYQTIWLNPDGGLDQPWTRYEFLSEYHPSNLHARDMDGDGRQDLVFTEGHSHRKGSSRVGIWFNRTQPDGKLSGKVEVLGTVAQDPENLAVEDLDDNGVPDIVTGAMNWRNRPASASSPSWNDRNGNLVIFAGKHVRENRCAWVKSEVKSGIAALHHLSLADMNGDGLPDILGENAGAAPPPAPKVPTVQILLRQ